MEHETPPAMNGDLEAASMAGEAPAGPVAEHERIITLDVLRGIALLGIFFVNMQVFAMPLAKFYGTPALAEAPPARQWAWAFVHVFCQYKFISLFSLLFGMGLAVALIRAQRAGRPFALTYLRRILILAVVGAMHGFLLWYGDILLIYALLGVPLLLLARLRPSVLIAIAAVLLTINVAFAGAYSFAHAYGQRLDSEQAALRQGDDVPVDSDADEYQAAPEEEPVLKGLAAMEAAHWQPMSQIWMEAETRAFRDGPWAEAMIFRSVTMAFNVAMIFFIGWGILGLFLLGAALMKLGFFGPQYRRWHIAATVIGLGIGLPVEAFTAWLMYNSGWAWNYSFAAGQTIHDVGRLFMLAGYVGGITLLMKAGAIGWVANALASVGRMALTNYLLQSVIATAIMYHWGFGLFGEVDRAQQLGLVALIFLAQIIFSVFWLRAFRFGPMEWLWRSLTYMKWQPLMR
jgi:uncharacterized protein